MKLWCLLSLVAAAALTAGSQTARADFLTLNFPGASNTYAAGIDGSCRMSEKVNSAPSTSMPWTLIGRR